MTTPIVYASADASAPVLNGANRTLNNVLHACLVTGYGSKAAAGWTREFDSGTFSVFRPGAGNRLYLQVDGSSEGSWNTGARHVDIRGFESMSAFDTGIDPFPTVAQLANGLEVVVSKTDASTPNRPWILVADNRTFYLFIDAGSSGVYYSTCFGDLYSYKPGDTKNTIIVANHNSIFEGRQTLNTLRNNFSMVQLYGASHVTRNHTGVTKSALCGHHADLSTEVALSGTLRGALPYPNASDNRIWLSPVYVHTPADSVIRGKFRGFWQWMHAVGAVADRDTFSGTGDFAGKTFIIIKSLRLETENTGIAVIETTAWPTST